MSAFRFPLERVLGWRRAQLEIEEARYRERRAALAALERESEALEASGVEAQARVRGWHPLSGADLAALDGFRRGLRTRRQQIAVQRARCVSALEAQSKAMLEAQRRCRLLERLRERREAEWRAATDHALEELAGESYLARWRQAGR